MRMNKMQYVKRVLHMVKKRARSLMREILNMLLSSKFRSCNILSCSRCALSTTVFYKIEVQCNSSLKQNTRLVHSTGMSKSVELSLGKESEYNPY